MTFLAILLLTVVITSIEIIFKTKKPWQRVFKASIVVLLVCIMSFLSYKVAKEQHSQVLGNIRTNIETAVKNIELTNKNIELSLFTTSIDYFKLNLLKNPNEGLCILLYTNKEFPNFNFQLANRYYSVGMYKEAIKKYKLAIEDLQELPDSQKYLWKVECNLALAYNAIGNAVEAKEVARKCLEINPDVDAAKKILEAR